MDDLNSFFAKKAARKKKPAAQDTESLVKRLEKAVRHQMQVDISQEEERISKERMQVAETRPTEAEDSEWIDLQDETEMVLAGKGLKELDIENIEEEDKVVSNERIQTHKTWNVADGEKAEDAEPSKASDPAPVPAAEQKPAKYIAPGLAKMSMAAGDSNKKPNLQDAQEFPSLMAAEDLDKKEIEKKKLKAQQAKEYEEREKEMMARRDKGQQQVSENETGQQNKLADSTGPLDTPVNKPQPQAYVPPHLRNK